MRAKEVVRKMFEDIKSNWYLPVTEWQVYSEGEQKIGVWTDGKPIYRKIVPFNVNTYEDAGERRTFILATVQNVENVVNHYVKHKSTADGYLSGTTFQGTTPIKPQWSSYCYIANGVMTCNLQTSTTYNMTVQSGYAILEYTKTTDTAATPKVPFEPLHEWSTEERHVGYWVDGSPVYRKTIKVRFTSLAPNVWAETNVSIPGINRPINGVMSNSATCIPILVYNNPNTGTIAIMHTRNSTDPDEVFDITITYTKTT